MQTITPDLFENPADPWNERIGSGTMLLHGFVLAQEALLLAALRGVIAEAPFRRMQTPGGRAMSVATTSCGRLGWMTDRRGYRYVTADPLRDQAPWPTMPPLLATLAEQAAALAGFPAFRPDSCLINRYVPGAKMSLHQDKDEADFSQPIVSVSLGLPAVFQFGGLARSDKAQRYLLTHGDVVVWGGPDRLRFHGVLPVKPGEHPRMGAQRINLTFRVAG
ncbi:DNA oxidative demethylase AlkB [Chimaeribacter californicus]|uniref:DNA oxidative demethylase AlkB n=1 Tax=Chimaeribacter californicus TaxID=2060067 RepID=A0A2N5EDR6_9GAMM|nr:DNA oxidative demethylase AlkB [Chimaeribacter californicus]